MRVGAAQCGLARDKGSSLLSSGYIHIDRTNWSNRFSGTILPVGVFVLVQGQRSWLVARQVKSSHTSTLPSNVVRSLNDPGTVEIVLSSARRSIGTAFGASRGPWCKQVFSRKPPHPYCCVQGRRVPQIGFDEPDSPPELKPFVGGLLGVRWLLSNRRLVNQKTAATFI